MKLRRRRATPSWPCIRRKIQRVARSNILRPRRRRRSGPLRQPPPPRRSLAPRRRRRGRRRPSPSRGPKHQTRPLPSKRSERLLLPRTAPRGRARRIFRALCRRLNSPPLWRSKTRPCRNQTSVSDYSHFRGNATLADRKRTSDESFGSSIRMPFRLSFACALFISVARPSDPFDPERFVAEALVASAAIGFGSCSRGSRGAGSHLGSRRSIFWTHHASPNTKASRAKST